MSSENQIKKLTIYDNENLIALYKRLIEYKNNLFKIDTLISQEKDNDTIKDKAIDENLDVQIVEDGDIRMAVVFR